ncbi:MAG TPA: PEGA domain-containing protein, partial [Myxococcaceae bacterium]|nr:PEGA domain-containing protein [Myxococcaceae bacterium]
KRDKGVLRVESVPPRAHVWIRGEPRGQTPVADLSLTAGRHQLLIRRPGYLPFGAFPDVKAGQSTEVEAVLEPTGGLAAMQENASKIVAGKSLHSSKPPAEAKAIGERLGARYLILAKVGRGGSELYAWDLSTGDKLSAVRVESPDAAAEQVYGWIEHPPSFNLAEHVHGVARKWWFWAGVAGAAAVVTGVVVASGGHPHSTFPGGVPF